MFVDLLTRNAALEKTVATQEKIMRETRLQMGLTTAVQGLQAAEMQCHLSNTPQHIRQAQTLECMMQTVQGMLAAYPERS